MGKNDRPLGITIIAILQLIGAVIAIIAGILFTFVLSLGTGATDGTGFPVILSGFIGAIFIIPGAIALLLGIGMLKGWKWIWYVEVIFLILGLIGGIGSVIVSALGGTVSTSLGTTSDVTTSISMIASSVVDLAITALFLWYMFKKDVKSFFGI